MKKIKISVIAMVALVMGIAGSAFTRMSDTKIEAGNIYNTIYKLKDGGAMLNRTDWLEAPTDPSCSVVHSNIPCRIQAEPDGDNPSESSFDDILSGSNDFQQAYSGVTYRP